MNVWLHETVLHGLAANGGEVANPARRLPGLGGRTYGTAKLLEAGGFISVTKALQCKVQAAVQLSAAHR